MNWSLVVPALAFLLTGVSVIVALTRFSAAIDGKLSALTTDMQNVKRALGLGNGAPEPVFIRSSLITYMKGEADKEHARLDGKVDELRGDLDALREKVDG